MMRWRGQSANEVQRRHERISTAIGRTLPTATEEAEDEAGADEQYEDAAKSLRERTRDATTFPLVADENAEYGFRRNLLGIRPYGLASGLAGATVGAAVLTGLIGGGHGESAAWAVAGAASLGETLFFLLVVRPAWVRSAADLYAHRLLDAADLLGA
jgi:hypothetical protein